MKCNMKFLLKIAGALAAVVALAYWALPGYHAEILALMPLSVVVLCPLSMMMMMWAMQRHDESANPALPPPAASPTLAQEPGRTNQR
ncbi:DUF2933 domain-containing protein [Paraburkholderia megapolitana]|uniref:DUF2933 domain-containing protein n=1 Tax=Paraburkholderia megapolitana TaxID=420953 RepID=A0A1I3PT85_9BURK|nr:DUF2933 domain-containing protein [Paraburkholderia megapolitana]QDQ80995.1 DUF2933 domain-containing protein [Paraburkholderia megapolitana]SFJ24994.1 Protein of unknown function [Paraburkholderia megapolitana]